jgi:hypothetical protein
VNIKCVGFGRREGNVSLEVYNPIIATRNYLIAKKNRHGQRQHASETSLLPLDQPGGTKSNLA